MYKKFFTTITALCICVLTFTSQAQTKAVTEHGDTIFVYDNGTWSYELLEGMPELENEMAFLNSKVNIDTLSKKFKKPANLTKQVTNKNDMFTIFYDDTMWKRVPSATLNEDAEFAFQAKESDIWVVVISEETSIDMDKLLLIAKNTMKQNTGIDPEILKSELRNVNGHDVLRAAMKANFSGIELVFDSYYYSDENGSVQFTTWTSQNVWQKNNETIEELLNGFVVKK